MRKQFRRGFSLARASFTVLRHNPKLTVLPMISFTIFLLVVGSILASLMPQFGLLHKLTGGILGEDRPPHDRSVLGQWRRHCCDLRAHGGRCLHKRGTIPLRSL